MNKEYNREKIGFVCERRKRRGFVGMERESENHGVLFSREDFENKERFG